MRIREIHLYFISSPLKAPFVTHLETLRERQAIIVVAVDQDGIKGYGEVTAFSSPWYTEETIQTAHHMLKDFFIPSLFEHTLNHPDELQQIYKSYRRNNMAKSGLEQAIWDLYAKQKDISLSALFGGTAKEIPSGAVISASSVEAALSQIESLLPEGYQRYKIKISRDNDYDLLQGIRKSYPNIPLMADANSAYTLKDIEQLKALDDFNLMMIEQPLAHDDIVEHSILQKELKTPVCLDESINSFQDAKSALISQCCRIINIKMSKVGGWSQAKRIHDLCLSQHVPVWCGGMVEFGISRAHNIALASLPGFSFAGDISSSSRYWEHDIIDPEVIVQHGMIKVPEKSGIGFDIDEKRLSALTFYKEKHI